MKTYSLQKFVHRVLVVRLVLATAAIAVAMALTTYVIRQAHLGQEVADLGRRGVSNIVEKIQFVMERQQTDAVTASREVLGRGDPPVAYRTGRFVYVQIYDNRSTVLAEQTIANQPGIDAVKNYVASHPFTFPDRDRLRLLQRASATPRSYSFLFP